MPQEQFNPNPDSQETVPNPITDTNAEAFDAKGKPRRQQLMPDGTYEDLSDSEYTEVLQNHRENSK